MVMYRQILLLPYTTHTFWTNTVVCCSNKLSKHLSIKQSSLILRRRRPLQSALTLYSPSLPITVFCSFFLYTRTCLTSACRCLTWTHCSKCLLCCSAARSNSCCFSWRNSSRSWTRVDMSTSLSHNSSTPAKSRHVSMIQTTIQPFFFYCFFSSCDTFF